MTNIFPIEFPSPAEAVKAIYEMKKSNPSALIKVKITWIDLQYNDKEICESEDIVLLAKEKEFLRSLDQYRITSDLELYNHEEEEIGKIGSITITSIQSQPYAYKGMQELGARFLVLDGYYKGEVVIAGDYGKTSENLQQLGVTREKYPERKQLEYLLMSNLIKLPLLPNLQTDDCLG